MIGQHPNAALGVQSQGQLKVIDAADMGLTEIQVAMMAALASVLHLANTEEESLDALPADKRERVQIAMGVLLSLAPRREEIMQELAIQAQLLEEVLTHYYPGGIQS